MIKQPGNIYTNFQVPSFPQKASKRMRALILGFCGNGKTSFLNKISGKNYKTGFSRGTLTRQIVYEDSCYLPERVLRIYDTPGTNSKKQAMIHALILRRSITALPLNLILIQSKFDCRFEDNTLTQLKFQASIFEKYNANIILLISHLDVLQKEKEEERQIILNEFIATIKQIKMKAKIIMYSNMNSDFSELTKIIYTAGYDTEQVTVQINDDTFYKKFKISNIGPQLIGKQIQEYIQEVKEAADMYINAFRNIPVEEQNIEQYIIDLKRDMKNDLKGLQDQQYRKYEGKFELYQSADLYLLISQIIHGKLEQLDLITDERLKGKVYFEIQSNIFDIRDLLKDCPYCGLRWMRVQGCVGETFCGGKPSQYDISDSKCNFNYEFKRNGGKIQYFKSQRKQLSQQQQTRLINHRNANSGKMGSVGCKRKMVWSQLPRLNNIEQILKDLYHVSNFQEIKYDYQRLMRKQEEQTQKINEKVSIAEEKIRNSIKQ